MVVLTWNLNVAHSRDPIITNTKFYFSCLKVFRQGEMTLKVLLCDKIESVSDLMSGSKAKCGEIPSFSNGPRSLRFWLELALRRRISVALVKPAFNVRAQV